MAEDDRIDDFGGAVGALERAMSTVRDGAGGLSEEMEGLRRRLDETSLRANGLNQSLSSGLKRSFDDLIFDGARLSDVMRGLARSMSQSIYSSALRPVFSHLGTAVGQGIEGVVSGLFAKGGSFASGRVMPFASGGIVTGPVAFPMRGGAGLMGEAGAEAILPLRRGADGTLGVAAEGQARPITVVVNVTTPDVAGFARSESQIATQMARALSRGQRNR